MWAAFSVGWTTATLSTALLRNARVAFASNKWVCLPAQLCPETCGLSSADKVVSMEGFLLLLHASRADSNLMHGGFAAIVKEQVQVQVAVVGHTTSKHWPQLLWR